MVALWLVGCVTDRLSVEVPIVAGGTAADTLSTADGGTLVLEEATVVFSDLRLEEPPEAEDMGVALILRALSPVGTAWAHPGHDYPGDVAGELLGTFTVDLLAEDAELGVAACYEGKYATGRVSVSGTVAVLAGTHTSADGETRPFRFEVPAEQDIIGIPFEENLSFDGAPTAIEVRFDPAAALQYVDWSGGDDDGDGILTGADATYGNTALFGTVATPSWSITLVP